MRIVTLLENESENKKLHAANGLSLYIESYDKKILFDLGPNNYYKKNAKKLGIDLTDIDILVVSHGHNDHGTGIKQFLKLNQKADVYVSEFAFTDLVKSTGKNFESIGIGKAPSSSRIKYVGNESIDISNHLLICDNVPYKKQVIGDSSLMVYEDGHYVKDHFDHEIYLVIKEEDNNVLFSGCSHKGIDNILHTLEEENNLLMTHIVGGLHFSHYDSFNLKQTDYLQTLGATLKKEKDMKIFACHCTGNDAFFELKQSLRENLNRLKTGDEIII